MKKILTVLILLILITSAVMPVAASAQGDDVASMDGVELQLKPMCAELEDMIGQLSEMKNSQLNRWRKQRDNKYAVVIGISDYAPMPGYPPGSEDLWNADKTAMEMTQALIEEYGFPEQNVLTLLNGQATAQGILGAIQWLALNTDRRSSVMFFYSGHGGQAPDAGIPELMIPPLDTDIEDDGIDEGIISHDLYPISDGMLKEMFSHVQARKLAMVFDCCYSGGMFDDDDDLQARGRVIVSACKADQLTYDVLALENTLFGYYFVDQAILNGLADAGRPGVSMEEAHAYAAPLCAGFAAAYGLPPSQPQIYDGYWGQLIP